MYRYNFDLSTLGLGLLLFGLGLMAVTIIKNKWIISGKVNVVVRVVELLVAAAIALLSYKEQWRFPIGIFTVLVVVILFSLYWERDAGQQLYVRVDDAGVHMPVTSRKRFVPWVEADQVLLRYGVLSVDCLNNKLYQFDVSASRVNTEEFNAFCAARIEEQVPNRIKNEW